MRAGILILLLLGATACEREPSFDERYAETRKRIDAKSQELDAELAGQRPAGTSSTSPAS